MPNIKTLDRSLAILLLATAIIACFEAWFVVGLGHADSAEDGEPNALALPLLAIFVGSAVVCFVGAWWSWRRADGEDLPAAQPTQLFGRNAASGADGRPHWYLLILALPVIVLAAAGVNHTLPRTGPPQGDVVAVQPDEPPPLQDIAAAPEQPAPPHVSGDDIAVVPPPQDTTPLQPQEPIAPAPPPPQAAIPDPASLPVTTAPLPERVPLPAHPSGHRDSVVWLDVSPDGRTLLSASTDRTIKLWDIEEKRLIRDLGTHKDMARTALFMPDGTHALTAADDGEIVLRSLADGAARHVYAAGKNGGVNKLAIAPDGRRAVSGHNTGTIIVWDIQNVTALHVLTGHAWSISSVAVSPDGVRALSSSIDGELRLWDIEAGRLLRRWQGHERGAYGAVFTADRNHAFTGSGDLTIKIWDLDTGKEIKRLTGHSGTVYALALSNDGRRLLSASLDGSARLWDTASDDQIAIFDPGTGPIHSIAFAGDGSVLTGGIDRTIRRWSVGGGEGDVLFAGAPG